jgi:hypothetical protein
MMADMYDKMRHALGVAKYIGPNGPRWSKPYRNHFCAAGDDIEIWEKLAERGYATRTHTEVPTGGPLYAVLPAGQRAALTGIVFKRRWGYGEPANGDEKL